MSPTDADAGHRQRLVLHRPLPVSGLVDPHRLAEILDAEARELLERCEEVRAAVVECIEDWNPCLEEDRLDPGAELVPYDSLVDLRDLAKRTSTLVFWLQLLLLVTSDLNGPAAGRPLRPAVPDGFLVTDRVSARPLGSGKSHR